MAGTCVRIIQGCLMLLVPLSLGGAFHLSWAQYLRVLIIAGGLLYLYFRYGTVGGSEGEDPDGGEEQHAVPSRPPEIEEEKIGRHSSILLSLLFAFVITQFDPILSSASGETPGLGSLWFFIGTTVLILIPSTLLLSIGVLHPPPKPDTRSEGSGFGRLDLLVLGIGALIVISSLVVYGLPDLERTVRTVKVGEYILLFFLMTRLPRFLSRVRPGTGHRRTFGRMVMISICTFGVIVVIGLLRTGAIYYDMGRGDKHFGNGDLDSAKAHYEKALGANLSFGLGALDERAGYGLGLVYMDRGDLEGLYSHEEIVYKSSEILKKLEVHYREAGDEENASAVHRKLMDTQFRYEFDVDGYAEGWYPANQMSAFVVEDGVLKARSLGRDPYMVSKRNLGLDTDLYTDLEIRMRVSRNSMAELFWMTARSSIWNPEMSVRLPVRGGDRLRVYRVNLGELPQWNGEIKRLRFDPVAESAGTEIEIDHVYLLRAKQAPKDPPRRDAVR